MPQATTLPEFYQTTASGPALQYQVPAAAHQLPTSVAAGRTASSAVIPSDGYQKIALSVTSTEAGTLTLQRYLDASGTVPQGAALQASIAAGQPALVNAVNGLPFQSLTVSVSNSGGTGANLTNLVVLLQGN